MFSVQGLGCWGLQDLESKALDFRITASGESTRALGFRDLESRLWPFGTTASRDYSSRSPQFGLEPYRD